MGQEEKFEEIAKACIQAYLNAKNETEIEEVLIAIIEDDFCVIENLVKWAAAHLEMKQTES